MARIRLPGGVSVWRGRWLLFRGHVPSPARDAPSYAGELEMLVNDVAKRAGLDLPRLITLGGRAEVTMRHDVLSVGLPLIWGLPAEQLGVVIAHELALPPPARHHRLTRALLDVPDDRLKPLAVEVEQARDAAAIEAVGGGLAAIDDAAMALLRAEAVRAGFDEFAAAWAPHHVSDLHAGWWELSPRLSLPSVRREQLASDHPGLANELLDAPDDPVPALDSQAVPLEPVPDAEAHRLAVDAIGPHEGGWVRFADLATDVYAGDVELLARQHVETVESLLGGPPADRDELVEVLLGLEDGTAMIADLIEYTMMKKGGKRRHPAVRWRMVNTDGTEVDLDAARRSPQKLRFLLG